MLRIKSTQLNKEYDLNKAELIGQGNFAQVYRIFDSDMNDFVAIRKVAKEDVSKEDILKQKIINQQLRKVDHMNILKIYDIIETPDSVWYITEYCSGGSLWDLLNICKDNKMEQKQTLQCILQVSKGVQELHNHRITHRDLKPQNILLKTKYIIGKPTPLIKLADFGLSTQKIIMQTIAGTKQYIAPQQAKYHNYTNAVDVWSIGIICDEILHGTPFFSGQSNKEVFIKISKTAYRVRNENIRPSIQQLLISLLKKKPYERPIIAVITKNIGEILMQIDQELKIKSKKIENFNLIKTDNVYDQSNYEDHRIRCKQQEQQKIITTGTKLEKHIKQQRQNEKVIYLNHSTLIGKKIINKTPHPIIKNEGEINYVSSPKNLQKCIENKQIKRGMGSIEKQKIRDEKYFPSKQILFHKKQHKKQENDNLNIGNKSNIDDDDIQSQLGQLTFFQSMNIKRISLFKINRKKNYQIKKDQIKPDIIEINKYVDNLMQMKNQVHHYTLHLCQNQEFIPQSNLNLIGFPTQTNLTSLSLVRYKQVVTFINYFSSTQEYELRILNAPKQLRKVKNSCIKQLEQYNNQIKECFFSQIDSFIDQYVQQNLK